MPEIELMSITAPRALYIKLGEGNSWAKQAFETNTLRFGFEEISHDVALAAMAKGDFTRVADYYRRERNVAAATATRYSNEVREFYTAGTDVLWITFAQGRLWWCFADREVFPTIAENRETRSSKYRRTMDHWSDKDLKGQTLWTNGLRGSLTTTAGFRGTICRVREVGYLLRRLNGEVTLETESVRTARLKLIDTLVPLIRGLHWKDFELLVMTQGGWRRVSATGGTQHTTDLELELPLTGERAIVQVKSQLEQSAAGKIARELVDAAGDARVFIAYHTSSEQLAVDQENITLIGPDALAAHVVDLGLTTWVMGKVG
jgi:hypothetical protein